MTHTLLAVALWAASPALAQDLDDLPESDIPEAEAPDSPAAPADGPEDAPTEDEPEGDEDFADESDESDALFEAAPPSGDGPGEGEDTADIYRKQVNELLEADAEERLQAWEAYLAEYPNSAFREQISKEIAAAEEELYGSGIRKEVAQITDKRQIRFPEMALGENLNPATRIRAGFEMGLPSWLNLIADAEYAFSPRVSVHGGLRKRFTGWSFEGGARVALLKMEDPGLIVSVAADTHVNMEPTLLGLRPTLAAGVAPIDGLFLQVQGSQEWELYAGAWAPRYRGGGNLTFRPAQAVAMFVEGMAEMKYPGWPGGDLQFHQVSFGMRFYPAPKTKREDMAEVMAGAAVMAYRNYWNFYGGAAAVSAYGYLE